ncbi:hypothetical protein L6164_003044 [Bauhinia variegata]|uniref:Uncharacterized protein n=1 Tax=Bauhinia variegata TaxID=167791 RepID=A0ACB9Q2T3_BAUVA|nr:hypothetical protein L6164_003044 [Bauhinia variegata]
MDMEGSDGSERGEDDASFEKQSALFALAVADVVLINMWCQDIGREQAANKPLLRTVFQQLVEHVYQAKVNRLRLQHLKKFMKAFNKGSEEQNRFNTVADYIQYCLLQFDKDCAAIKVDKAKWDSLKARAKLGRDMKSYAAIKREDRPAFIVRRLYEPTLKQEISEFVGHF